MKENKIHRMFGHPLLYVSILSLPGGCVFGTHAGAGKKVDPAAGPKTETKTKKAPPTKKKAATTKPVVGTAGAGTGLGGGGSTPAPTVPPSTGSSNSNISNQNSSPAPVSNKPIPSKPKKVDELMTELQAIGNNPNSSPEAINEATQKLLDEIKNMWPGLREECKVDLDGLIITDQAFNEDVDIAQKEITQGSNDRKAAVDSARDTYRWAKQLMDASQAKDPRARDTQNRQRVEADVRQKLEKIIVDWKQGIRPDDLLALGKEIVNLTCGLQRLKNQGGASYRTVAATSCKHLETAKNKGEDLTEKIQAELNEAKKTLELKQEEEPDTLENKVLTSTINSTP